MVDHELIAAKLEHYGVRGVVLDIFNSFLANRNQVVDVAGERSEPGVIGDRSVPQGSNVGNTIFSVLMNDLPFPSPGVEFIMYADDICAIVHAADHHELQNTIKYTIVKLLHWFSVNGMQLNVDKTNLLQLSLKFQPKLQVSVNGSQIEPVPHARYVGFTFDSGLQWCEHINKICAKLNSAYYAISRLKQTLTVENLITAYYAYFHTHLVCGIDLWGLAAERDRPFILQKKVIRLICRVPPDEPARQLFVGLGIMTVPSLYIFEVGRYVRRNLTDFPVSRSYSARRKPELAIPAHRLKKTGKSLAIMGARIYNKLPEAIRASPTERTFTHKLKVFCTNKAYYAINEFLHE